jgi:hypothetical protein
MCGGGRGPSFEGMNSNRRIHRFPTIIAAALLTVVCVAALWPAAGHAADRRHVTIRVFSKLVGLKLTKPDGTVITTQQEEDPQPGDVLDVYSLDFRGDHKHHSKHFIGSEHVHCVFGAGEPDCVSHVALGGSLLIFTGNPATLSGGTGRFQGATGTATSKEVAGGADGVAKITLAKRHP